MKLNAEDIKKINIVSDTHYDLSESAYNALNGDFDQAQIYESKLMTSSYFLSIKKSLDKRKPDLIIHAGDIGSRSVLLKLEEIAPIVAVHGNCDFDTFQTQNLEFFEFDELKIVVAHRPYEVEPYYDKADLIIHGHTHRAEINMLDNDSLLICPGSASMGRYGTPESVATVYVCKDQIIFAELIEV